jgi:hypothetical protein
VGTLIPSEANVSVWCANNFSKSKHKARWKNQLQNYHRCLDRKELWYQHFRLQTRRIVDLFPHVNETKGEVLRIAYFPSIRYGPRENNASNHFSLPRERLYAAGKDKAIHSLTDPLLDFDTTRTAYGSSNGHLLSED